MALLQNCCILLAVLAVVFVQRHHASLVGRCRCHEKVGRPGTGKITDFTVWEKHPGCDSVEVEVEVTLQNKTESVCLKTEGRTGKAGNAFVLCWERIKKNETSKAECMKKYEEAIKRRGIRRRSVGAEY